MKLTCLLFPLLAITAFGANNGVPFGKLPDGTEVKLFTLTNTLGMVAKVSNLGATLVEARVPDKDGKMDNVVLGFDDAKGYLGPDNQYFGCTLGRMCNRVARGHFSLGGKDHRLAINNEPNHLHGGARRSFDKVVWKAYPFSWGDGSHGVLFKYRSIDGEEGYPGTVEVSVRYVIAKAFNTLRIICEATTDKPTPLAMSNHAYFNLAGAGALTISDHQLRLNADRYLPTDEFMIPTGEIAPTAKTPLDFKKFMTLAPVLKVLVGTVSLGLDHTFVLDHSKAKNDEAEAAMLQHAPSGRRLKVSTTENCLHVYSGNFLRGQAGRDGKRYHARSGICLMPQAHPNAVNTTNFPSVILQPGQTYKSRTVYNFQTYSPTPPAKKKPKGGKKAK